MPLLRSLSPTTRSIRIRRRRRRRSCCSSIASPLVILVSCCYYLLLLSPRQYHHHLSPLSPVSADSSTIPRSTNRYSNYNRQSSPSSSSSSISTPSLSSHDYHPPWNPSPKIDPHGFLTNLYPRTPGEWEHLANIRGRYGPRSRSYPNNLRGTPVEIRQVPGDGNCLFHSIAACLFYSENEGRHLPMDSHERILELRSKSLQLRNAAVDVLEDDSQNQRNNLGRSVGRRKLFLQGEEYLEARELLAAAAAQFDLEGEEYCELMRKESYWGGGPEIVALCNYLQRPIHIYELVPTTKNNKNEQSTDSDDITTTSTNNLKHAKNTCNQFTLRRMACFGSPRYDRREPLHILSADSRFPDVEPKRIRRVGNHFLALFPVTKKGVGGGGGGGGLNQFRNHALLRGGSRVVPSARVASRVDEVKQEEDEEVKDDDETVVRRKRKKISDFKWDGGRGTWDNDKVTKQ